MNLTDVQGNAVSGATNQALDPFEQAHQEMRCYIGDPLASAKRAIALAPEMTMAHVLVAWFNLLGTEPAGFAEARAALATARRLPANDREKAHLKAIESMVAGQWHAASRVMEDLSVQWPVDAFALQAGHQIDFFTGHTRMLRDRIARALPAWDQSRPGYHAILGMYAFGLEENADYARAESYGRQAVELERRDGWGWHAVAHVMEMQNRRREGVEWLTRDIDGWSRDSFFQVHNAWHLALFHLGLDQLDDVLAIVDKRVLGGNSAIAVEMLDASAMLWRLHLRGVDVGNRWQALADRWKPHTEAGNYAFNDFHAMMAFAGAGRDDDAQTLLQTQQRALGAADDNAGFLKDVGADATQAIWAFHNGRYGECVSLLRPLRSRANRFGGSHAQRDLIDLTMLEAATRDGQQLLAEALRAERTPAH